MSRPEWYREQADYFGMKAVSMLLIGADAYRYARLAAHFAINAYWADYEICSV